MGGASCRLVVSRGVVELTLVSHWYGVTPGPRCGEALGTPLKSIVRQVRPVIRDNLNSTHRKHPAC